MKIRMNGLLTAHVAMFFVVVLGLANTVSAQVESGTINGVVLDNSGAVISGARVTVTNTATSQARKTVTNTSGEYSAPFLAPGTYDVEASKDGFANVLRRGLTLQVDQTLAINITLKPGSVKET